MTTTQRELQRHADIICFSLICSLVLWQVLNFIDGQFFSFTGRFVLSFLPLIYYVLRMALPILILRFSQKVALPAAQKTNAKLIFRGIALLLGCSGVVYLLNFGLYAGLSSVSPYMQHPALVPPTGLLPVFFFVLTYLIAPAILEEYLFRGLILTLLEEYGSRFALIVSSLLFALISLDPVRLPGLFLLGLALGWLVQRGLPLVFAMILRLLAEGYRLVYGLSIQLGGFYETLWSILILISGLAVLATIIFSILDLIKRTDASLATDVKLSPEQKLFRFFVSIPALAFAAAIIFLYIQPYLGA